MNTDNHFARVLERLNGLNGWLSHHTLHFAESNVLFAHDADVEYKAAQCQVNLEDLVTAAQFNQAFAPMLAGGPSWIHVNVIPFKAGGLLVTLAAGKKIGNPRPSINASCEPDKTAEILSAKTLVTAH